jgi:hypothetical protein
MIFSCTIFKEFFNILVTESKNKNKNQPFLTKDMNLKKGQSLALSDQNASRGKFK